MTVHDSEMKFTHGQWFSFGDYSDAARKVKDAKVPLIIMVQSVLEALKAAGLGADAIVAQVSPQYIARKAKATDNRLATAPMLGHSLQTDLLCAQMPHLHDAMFLERCTCCHGILVCHGQTMHHCAYYMTEARETSQPLQSLCHFAG